MAVAIVKKWTCDGCGVEVLREPYGLPPGWAWKPIRMRTVHYCPECLKEQR